MEFCYRTQVALELALPRLSSNYWSSCLYLLSVGILGIRTPPCPTDFGFNLHYLSFIDKWAEWHQSNPETLGRMGY